MLIMFFLVGFVFFMQSSETYAAEFNIYEKSGYSVEEFNAMLENTNLANHGEAFKNMEDNHNVNGIYAMSVAALESGFESRKLNSSNNIFGMMSKGKLIKYSSIAENINAFGSLMNKSIYKGKPISKIAKTYCPPNATKWESTVCAKYEQFSSKAR